MRNSASHRRSTSEKAARRWLAQHPGFTVRTLTPTEWLMAVHRIADEQRGRPLAQFLALFARELDALGENLDQLYDDQFIETCAPWAAPYIGDLIGHEPRHGTIPRIASPRAEVSAVSPANLEGHKLNLGLTAQLNASSPRWTNQRLWLVASIGATLYLFGSDPGGGFRTADGSSWAQQCRAANLDLAAAACLRARDGWALPTAKIDGSRYRNITAWLGRFQERPVVRAHMSQMC